MNGRRWPKGLLAGTLDYISPEQITNEAVTAQSDIYSLGAVLFETLTGERPYGDATVTRLLYSHLHEPIPLVTASRPDILPEVDRVLQKATAKKPAERYATVSEMAAAFRRALSGSEAETQEWSGPTIPAMVELRNPYKGLHAFGESDTEDFFGRETLVQQLLARLAGSAGGRESRFLAVVGPSGSGKSSVVKAGLIPALRQGGLPGSKKWFITEMTPGSDPLEELELALWRVAVNPPPSLVEPMRRDSGGILRTIRRILPSERESSYGGAQLLLIVDQFEELFTLVEDEEQRVFFLDSLLAAMRAPRSPLRVVVTLRADFYDRPLQYEEWGELIKQNTEIVLPLNRSELTWAVREPARRMGVGLEEGLAAAIVADVADQPGALPLLQYAMTELFERREGQRMTRVAYEQLGGVRGALGQRAEALYGDLPGSGQQIARQICLRLITLGEGAEDTRRRVLRGELEALSGLEEGDVGPSLVAEVLDRFGGARFLTFDRDPLTRAPTVEVAHEALLREWTRLRGWLDESRADVRLQRLLAQAASEWEAAGREAGYLLRDARLDQFAGWAKSTSIALTGDERAFLEASMAAREKRLAAEEERRRRELQAAHQLAEAQQKRAEEQTQAARRLRRRAVYLAGALLFAGVLAVLAFAASRQSSLNAVEARSNAERADANAAEAQANADAAATSAAESAANAALAQTREAEEALQRAAAQEAQAAAEAARVEADQARELAEQQVLLATSRELSLAALNTLDTDPELSILLALQALETAYSREAEDALHRAVQQSRLRQAMPDVWSAAFHPDGTQVATVGETGLQVWDLAAERVELTVPLPVAAGAIAYSPDGRNIATGHEDGRLLLWDAASGAGLGELEGHTNWVYSIDFSPDGRRLASTSADGRAILWDLDSGEAQFTFPGVVRWVSALSFSPDGALLAVPEMADDQTGQDGRVNVWDTASGTLRLSLMSAGFVAFSPDGAFVATGAGGRGIGATIWDLGASLAARAGRESAFLGGHSGLVNDVAFSPDGAYLSTCSQDTTAKVWEAQTGRELFTLAGHTGAVTGCAFSPDGRRLLTVGGDGVRIWDVSLPGNEEVMVLLGPGGSGLTSVALSPDGAHLALGNGSGNGDTYLYDAANGSLLAILTGHSKGVHRLVFSPNGGRLATASQDATVKVWDVAGSLARGEGVELLTLSGHGEGLPLGGVVIGVVDVAYSPDGHLLATGGADGTVRLWDAAVGDLLATSRVYPDESGVWSVAFSPDGQYLAASSEIPFHDGLVKVWRLAGDRIEDALTLDGLPARNHILAFSPDGETLLTSGGQPTLWDSHTGELVRSFAGHPSGAVHAAYSSDGRMVSTSGRDGMIRVFDVASGENLLAIDPPIRLVNATFSPDGKYLYVGSGSGFDQARVYALQLETLVSLAHQRLTRGWRPEECQQYLHRETCPEE
jgi:WD40 repeat protein